MAVGKGQFFRVWKCFRCPCTQGARGSAHRSFFFLVTRLPVPPLFIYLFIHDSVNKGMEPPYTAHRHFFVVTP